MTARGIVNVTAAAVVEAQAAEIGTSPVLAEPGVGPTSA